MTMEGEREPAAGSEAEWTSELAPGPSGALEEADALPGTSAPDTMCEITAGEDADMAPPDAGAEGDSSGAGGAGGEALVESAAVGVMEPGIPWIGWVDGLNSLREDLTGRLEQLRQMFEREVRAEATRERIVDRLHAELQEYKGDLVLQCLRPMFLDLIGLYDDLGKRLEGMGPEEPDARLAREVQQGILDVLYRQGVEPYSVEEAGFDPRRQRAIATVATEDIGLARTLARRIRPGFARDGKLIRPELVAVYVAAPAV